MRRFTGFALQFAVVVLCLGITNAAQAVLIINNSFEDPDVPGSMNGGFIGRNAMAGNMFPGWTVQNGNGAHDSGVWTPSPVHFDYMTIDGDQVAYTYADTQLFQDLGPAAAGTYTLSAFFGNPSTFTAATQSPALDYTLQLLINNVVVESITGTANSLPSGSLVQITLPSYDLAVAALSVAVRIGSIAPGSVGFGDPNYVTFDNVTLDFAPAAAVPEPASLTLMGLALVGVCGYRLRRKHVVS